MIHLREVGLPSDTSGEPRTFPFDVPALRAVDRVVFDAPVTFFVGENGSGKSTLLEALACAIDAVAAGSTSLARDGTLDAVRPLAAELAPVWSRRTRRGFFLRAEDFFGHVKQVNASLAENRRELARVRRENAGKPRGEIERIAAPFARSVEGLESRYGSDADAASHGEQYLDFLQSRLAPDGLVLLDEPEAALSPLRQLALLSILKEWSDARGCQFVIATHSPMLLALPGARIYSFDDGAITSCAYDELEHVRLTRAFLRDPDAYLRRI